MVKDVTQISVFLENRPGTLAKVAAVLAEAGTDIIALTVAEADQFGILRMIVSDPDAAARALEDSGYAFRRTGVVAVEMEDKPRPPDRLFAALGDAGINIDYLYIFLMKTRERAVAVLRTDDNRKARTVLASQGFKFIEARELHST